MILFYLYHFTSKHVTSSTRVQWWRIWTDLNLNLFLLRAMKGLRFVLYLQTNKLACHSFADAGIKRKTPGSILRHGDICLLDLSLGCAHLIPLTLSKMTSGSFSSDFWQGLLVNHKLNLIETYIERLYWLRAWSWELYSLCLNSRLIIYGLCMISGYLKSLLPSVFSFLK